MKKVLRSLRACLETTRGAAARDFGCGQGGEFRASPQRAVRNEPTPATDKRPAARRVFGEKAVWLRCSSVEDPPGIFSFVAPDTVSRVIRPSARRAHESSPQPIVDNSAAKNDLRPVKVNAGRIALRGSRSFAPRLMKTMASLPAPSAAARHPAFSPKTAPLVVSKQALTERGCGQRSLPQQSAGPVRIETVRNGDRP